MAKGTSKTLAFEASAYLQTLIGRELFRSQEFAVVELVKNAYDSGASTVDVEITVPTDTRIGQITVRDDGDGMTLHQFRRSFMFAGYSERPEQVESASRVPTGEKGIGRFATDRLGTQLSVTTKSKDRASALQVDIDWSQFRSRRRRFSDVQVPYRPGDVGKLCGASSGTVLKMTELRETWTRGQLASLRSTLGELLDPYNPPPDFRINLDVTGSKVLSGPVERPELPDPDIEVRFRVLSTGVISRALSGKAIRRSRREKIAGSDESKQVSGLEGRFLYYLKRPSVKVTHGLRPAVRVYRDGFRIEPFGTETSDWLGVAEKRAKRAGHAHIVPSRLFGFVAISRRQHDELRDTTSREALLDTEATRSLVSVLQEQLEFLEDSIRRHVSEPRWKASKRRKAAELEKERLHTLSIMSSGLAHELRQPLQAIRSESENIVAKLRQLKVRDRDIIEAQKHIEEDIDRIDKNIRLITEISNPDLDSVERFDLVDAIREVCAFFETRCSAQGIDMEIKLPKRRFATLTKAAVSMVLVNLIRNAFDALLEVADGRRKRIGITLSKTGRFHRIEVTDNADGIDDEIQGKIFKKFASRKTGGMGVGLYNCNVIVKANRGKMSFTSRKGLGSKFSVVLADRGRA